MPQEHQPNSRPRGGGHEEVTPPPTTVEAGAPTHGTDPDAALIAATSEAMPDQANALARARAFAEPLPGETMETGENTLAHADAVAAILKASAARKPCRRPFIWCTPACT
jgi:hypothetical protein